MALSRIAATCFLPDNNEFEYNTSEEFLGLMISHRNMKKSKQREETLESSCINLKVFDLENDGILYAQFFGSIFGHYMV